MPSRLAALWEPVVRCWTWGVGWQLLMRICTCDRCVSAALRGLR
jgi:hypothetical protein